MSHPILNPNTPLVFLPPSDAGQLEATRYLSVATLAVCLFSFLTVSADRLPKGKTSSPLSNCAVLPVAIGICWTIAIGSTSLLFFYRIKAVFDGNRPIILLFGGLWLANLGGAMTVPFALKAGNIADTPFCIPTGVKPFSSVGIITTACFDTLVFVAVSWNIIQRTAIGDKSASFLKGKNLPLVSRELLRGGQQYYLLTAGGNIFIMIILLLPSTPPLLRDMFPVINLLLENSMAFRVFRNIKLRTFRENRKGQLSSTENTLPYAVASPGRDSAYGVPIIDAKNALTGSSRTIIEITKTVEKYEEDLKMHNSAAESAV
ncbi:hypothetical protein Clacol_008003 [Clathrus columnatus]|uniref:Uncharacterized protein n=1 Tax=Clathrus columnatus TaxID=1419009 RepID=A0AAV5AJ11_9AGAM|nr:hypothetical protein Clacol_008003 [Clathrus columnatus]